MGIEPTALINSMLTNNAHDPSIYNITITVSTGIEPTSLINTKATNNNHDPTNYVISITVSMCITPTAPHTGSTQLYATGTSLFFSDPMNSRDILSVVSHSSRDPMNSRLTLFTFPSCTV